MAILTIAQAKKQTLVIAGNLASTRYLVQEVLVAGTFHALAQNNLDTLQFLVDTIKTTVNGDKLGRWLKAYTTVRVVDGVVKHDKQSANLKTYAGVKTEEDFMQFVPSLMAAKWHEMAAPDRVEQAWSEDGAVESFLKSLEKHGSVELAAVIKRAVAGYRAPVSANQDVEAQAA